MRGDESNSGHDANHNPVRLITASPFLEDFTIFGVILCPTGSTTCSAAHTGNLRILVHYCSTLWLRKREAGAYLHIGIAADVTVPSDVQKSVDLTTEALGTPTLLINCAGLAHATRFLDISEREWATVVAVSLTGPFRYAQACLPGMIKEGWGRIVNFSSTAGKSVSTLGGAHYTAAKTGLVGLTRAVAKEFAPAGITVNTVCPGLIDTPMAHALCSDERLSQYARSFPVGRLGKSAEVADLVAFLCSDSAAYITGAAIDINGGDLMV